MEDQAIIYILKDKILTVPYKRPYVKAIYIKMAIKLLEELGYYLRS